MNQYTIKILDNWGTPIIPTDNPFIFLDSFGASIDIRYQRHGGFGSPLIFIGFDVNDYIKEIEILIKINKREEKINKILYTQ
jgi:hypothetical protein